jgi:hypothetical protein
MGKHSNVKSEEVHVAPEAAPPADPAQHTHPKMEKDSPSGLDKVKEGLRSAKQTMKNSYACNRGFT